MPENMCTKVYMFYLHLTKTSFLIYLHRLKKNPLQLKKKKKLIRLSRKVSEQQEFNTQSDNRLVYKAILQLDMLRFECALFPLLLAPLIDVSLLAVCCNSVLWL